MAKRSPGVKPPLKPKNVGVCKEGIPPELLALPRWLCWRWEWQNGKWTKPPRCARSGRKEKDWCNPKRLVSFDEAMEACLLHGLDGVGFAFVAGDGYLGFDLDSCINGAGEIAPEALAIIRSLGSFTDYSPSGTGAKVIVQADIALPNNKDKKQFPAPWQEASAGKPAKVEVFRADGYFTLTGRPMEGLPFAAEGRQAEAEALLAKLDGDKAKAKQVKAKQEKAKQEKASARNEGAEKAKTGGKRAKVPFSRNTLPSDLSDSQMLDRMFAAKNGSAIRSLWNGDTSGYDTHSEADMALLSHLRWWTQANLTRVKSLFRQSGLVREDKDRDDYLDLTLSKMEGEPTWQPEPPEGFPSDTDGKDGEGDDYNLTDTGNAQRLAAWHRDDLRHVNKWKKWFAWDGRRWREDDALDVVERAKAVARRMAGEAVALMARIKSEMEAAA